MRCPLAVRLEYLSAFVSRFPALNQPQTMPIGIVKTYDEQRCFGFIAPDDGGADVFVHAKSINGASVLIPSQMVEFESVFDPARGKFRANDVRVI
jgi:CspA family cold shock protein